MTSCLQVMAGIWRRNRDLIGCSMDLTPWRIRKLTHHGQLEREADVLVGRANVVYIWCMWAAFWRLSDDLAKLHPSDCRLSNHTHTHTEPGLLTALSLTHSLLSTASCNVTEAHRKRLSPAVHTYAARCCAAPVHTQEALHQRGTAGV